MIEYEVTILDVDKNKVISTLEGLGAVKKGEYFQRRYVYDFNPINENKWLRLRTNGEKSTLTIKEIKDSNIVGGTKELEIEVSDFDLTNEMLEEMGYFHRNYEENKRITYELDNVEIDIDSWPLIPTYVEVEGYDEQSVLDLVKKININNNEVVTYGVVDIYRKYGIDILKEKNLYFKD